MILAFSAVDKNRFRTFLFARKGNSRLWKNREEKCSIINFFQVAGLIKQTYRYWRFKKTLVTFNDLVLQIRIFFSNRIWTIFHYNISSFNILSNAPTFVIGEPVKWERLRKEWNEGEKKVRLVWYYGNSSRDFFL